MLTLTTQFRENLPSDWVGYTHPEGRLYFYNPLKVRAAQIILTLLADKVAVEDIYRQRCARSQVIK